MAGEVITKGDLVAKKVQDRGKPDFHGNTTYNCELEDREGIAYEGVYVARKKPLNEGDELYGRIENNEYGYRFFSEQRDTVPTGNQGNAATGDRTGKLAASPARADSNGDSIEAQVALKAAVEYARVRSDAGKDVLGTEDIKGVAKTFAQAIREAKAA